MPRFDQSFTGLCEQNLQDTLQLKQRYLDAKAKRPPKAKDKKQPDQSGNQQQPASIQSSVHVQQKFLKRPAEDLDPSGGPQVDSYEPPVKLQCKTQNEGITKFSLEIVQQLEFTTSAASSNPQISANVTVKAHTNTSVKTDVSSPNPSNPSTPSNHHQQQQQQQSKLDVGTLVECVKQEPDNDFADLDQCAAALEKDAAANGGAAFGNFSDLIGDDSHDEIITSDAFNDLISDISNFPELMKDFDFEDNKPETNASANGLKVEDVKDNQSHAQQPPSEPAKNTQSPHLQNQNYSPSPVFDGQHAQAKPNNRMVYPNLDFAKTELNPAAQTLKQMAEQHHKNQMGLAYNPNNRVPNARSPYSDFQYNDYGSPTNPQFKNSPSFPQQDLIKQEMIFQGNDFDVMKRKGPSMYKQQYSPYSSPNHGSPGYLPRTNSSTSAGSTSAGPFGGGTPPRPPSGHGGGGGQGTTLQINQAQQMHINQQGHGHNIQVSAGQHLQLSGDIKGNVSIATHQGLHFSQQHQPQNNPSPQQQQSQNPQQNQMPSQAQTQMGGNNPQNVHGNVNMNPQGQTGMSNPMMSNAQQQQQQQNPNAQHMGSQQGGMGNPMQGGLSGMQGMGGVGMQGGMQGPGNMQPGMQNSAGMGAGGMQGGLGGMGGNNMMGGSQLHPGSMGSMNDTYSMSQNQTINFTQQTLRQRANGVTGMAPNMGPNPGMNPMNNQMGGRMMSQQQQMAMEQQQKLLQQQQMFRNQQQQQAAAAAMQQQQIARPPPPDYKTSAGMMQPRFGAGMRRMPHQPIPPSGPMLRPHNVYMLQQQQQPQQQHMASRNMYPRQQNPMTNSLESMQQKPEWRHLLLQQQQSQSFNSPIRPNFQHSFGMNPGNNMQQMTALQHQQMRVQHGLSSGGMGPGSQQSMGPVMNQGPAAGSPMSQMASMSQQQMQLMQQQNMMQQQSSQMSMASIHMQQSQSLSLNQALQHQQQQNQMNQLVNNPSGNTNALNNFNPGATDFNLEFLDNLPTSDSAPFTDQELLNSFDADSGFNLDF